MGHSPILPCGRVNLETGKFKYGNIYGFWGEDTCYELYKTYEGKYRIVSTAGTSPIVPVGKESSFKNDQTGQYLWRGEVIATAVGDEGLKSLAKYQKSIAIACYK